jgi:succinate dehydrogenase/fumarate reductase flavoprotein subunit
MGTETDGTQWDREVDVIVIGSGAAGMTAAVTAAIGGASVELLEKSDLIGGTTCVSGGGIWVPGNPHMIEMGLSDSRAEAVAYALESTNGRAPDPALVELYVDKSVEALRFLEDTTPIEFFVSEIFSDYYIQRHGSRRVGRTLDNRPFAAREELGKWDDRLRRTPHYPRLTLDEMAMDPARSGGAGAGAFDDALLALDAERAAAGIRTCGEALAGRLLKGCLDHGVVVRTGTPVRRLVLGEDHAVIGVVAEEDGADVRIRARAGVVLATGGFEWNPDLVRSYLGVREIRPVSQPHNTGDGLVMALEAGALTANMTEAWWFPVTSTGTLTYDGSPMNNVATPRAEAGCITVNSRGRRFTNEAAAYMDIGREFRTYDAVAAEFPNEVAWSVFDARVRSRIELADLLPDGPTPAWVVEADTLEDLAAGIGVPADVLVEEVERFNTHVAEGHDPDFGRGTLWFEAFTAGGPRPETSLAAIDRPPYYGIRLYNGVLGTCGGPRITADGQVVSARGGIVPGLYAAGNVSASVFGPGYPAGGATLGPAITFGYLAGQHVARVASSSLSGAAAETGA